MIKQLEQNYAVRDTRCLAMCPTIRNIKEQNRKNEIESTTIDTETLDQLNTMIHTYLLSDPFFTQIHYCLYWFNLINLTSFSKE